MTKLYEARNHILVHAEYADPAEHRHLAAHILVSLGGEMRVRSGKAEYRCQGILIPSGVVHEVETCGEAALVFLYDAATTVAKQMKDVQCISEDCCRCITTLYASMGECTKETYYGFESSLLSLLGFPESRLCVNDERIKAAMAYIRAALSENLTCQRVADAVHLSQGRFSHLFKKQTGMTFSAYLIFQRLMHAYARILRGASITEAALEAGFSSSAHFADINRRVFGLPASRITQELALISV